MKRCCRCEQEKERSEFNISKQARDGLQSQCKQCRHAYYVKHKTRLNRDSSAYQKARRKNDPTYLLVSRARCRARQALDGIGRDASTMELLGCTANQFREHIESQFIDGMAWGQRGKWSIDHIIPIAAFDLTDPKHQRYAFHWSNCQPLWAEDNLAKSDKYDPEELKKYLASPLMEYREKGKR